VTPFLLDANLSPETAAFLRDTFGFDATDLISRGLGHLRDVEVIALDKHEGRTTITFELDIQEIHRRGDLGAFGVILLRLHDQTVESVNRVLDRFFRDDAAAIDLDRSLVVVDESRARVVTRR
jgi:predicted nuclease of predicted toxin-antitoxin system